MIRLRNCLAGMGFAIAASAGVGQAASIYDDDFADGTVGSQWTTVTDSPARLSLAEQNGRLEMLATAGGSPNDDAIYLSSFRLSTASDFIIRLDYSFTNYTTAGVSGTAVGGVFGVGRDVDGTDSAAVGQGFGTTTLFGNPVTAAAATVGYRTDDISAQPVTLPFASTTGTFEISYDTAGDDLTLRRLDSGVTYTLTDTVRQVWGADDLLVSFGGRGSGFDVASGQAFVDNFTIVSGTVVPEPASLTALGLAGLVGLRRRR